MMLLTLLAAVMLNPSVEVKCERPEGWSFEVATEEASDGVRVARVRATSPRIALPPTFKVVVSFPQLDAEYVWNPNFGCGENQVFLPWWGNVYNVARTQPLRSWFNAQEENRLTLASSELRREVTSGGGLKEEDFRLYPSFTFFAGTREPLKEYETELRMDLRAIPFHQAIREAAAWQASKAGGAPAEPPAAAYEPLYSTWYNFHKDVTAEAVEAECAEAAKLGMKVLILDDGWQCDDIERSYQSCGDWRISTRRFPDMLAHVARVQALGLKYMMWFAMPYVGEKTKAYGRLKGKFLRYDTHMKAWVIDPRFPECRAYLRDVYLRCLKDWNIDGFKLDFVDAFGMEGAADPALAENYAGRDCRSIPEGVEKLLSEVTASLAAVKPGLLFEFRQAYVGPVIRKYGNMVRVGDCPGSQLRNRVHIANMRLLCDGTSVHADMLRWHPDETPENAQRFILSSLFGTVQYSVMLREAKPETKAMIAKWIRFSDEHRETLLKGAFRPHFPHLNYPVIESESKAERIVVIYDPSVKFDLGPILKPTYLLDGVSGEIKVMGIGGNVRSPVCAWSSPDGRVRADLSLADGEPEVALSYGGKAMGTMTLGPEYSRRGYGRYEVVKISGRTVDTAWKPVWGFRAEYPERYAERRIELGLPGKGETALTLTVRAYDEGFAARYELPLETYSLDEIRRDRIDFALPIGTVAWPIPSTEGTYPEEPLPVKDLDRKAAWRMPFTLKTAEGAYASILEANTVKWPRSFLQADGKGGLRSVFAVGTKVGREYVVSPWRVMMMAPSAGGLIERSYLVENLNEPCQVKDAADWVRPGLTTTDFGQLNNAALLSNARQVRTAAGIKYLQIDWGWYGTERPWTDAERAGYRVKRPDLKDEDWVPNTYADPHRPAKGFVPYHPFWERLINYGRKDVDLDIPTLTRDLKKLDMGLCLYLHGIVLEASDMEELFALYESWGVAGLKPGFVSYGSQQATDYLRRMADCAARHHLWLDIHDEQIPDGFERTWPNVMISEGGGGEEGHHPLRQDCALPFARCLAGPFDYTPRFFDPHRTKAHAAAMLVVYPGPTAVLRWPRDGKKTVADICAEAPDVMSFVRRLPMNYDESRVLVGEIAKRIVVARRKGNVWCLGGLCGEQPTTVTFPLDFLKEGTNYSLTLVCDDGTAETRSVRSREPMSVEMARGGGFIAVIEEKKE